MSIKKYWLHSFICILLFLVNINVCYGLDGIVNGTSIHVRSGAGTSYESLGKVDLPSVYTLLDENKISPTDGTSANCSYWYKISYNNQDGYICSIYLTIVSDKGTAGGTGDFEADLVQFPDSYKESLRQLHSLYPNATFTAFNTGLDWQTVVDNENYIKSGSPKNSARSLMQTKYDGYKSTNSIVYNWATNIWNTNISGGGSSWFAAHEDVISYYLDPRNFLTYNSVFMFLNHGYSTNINYNEGAIDNILKGSFMSGNMTNDNVHSFANAFIDAGRQSGISPYYLAARVIQEIGRSSTRSSYVNGSSGYYNYYNIDASGNDHLANALNRAKNEGWDDDYKAIVGGAKFIADGYVSTGQSTLYLEKWDVVDGGNGFYSHQYMQNIQAPVSEANTLYNTYLQNDLMTGNMEFLIPVYTGMTAGTKLPNTGNPNNYLREVTINGYVINGFDINQLEYNYNVSSVTNQVEIGANKIANTSSVNGIGTIEIKDNSYTHSITVTAENGNVRTYKINFTKDDDKPISISDIINSKGYVSDGVYLSGINVGTSADSLADNLKSGISNISISITNSAGSIKTTDTVATGDKVTITSGNETKTYTVIIYGDLNGDGKIASSDYVFVKNYIMGTKVLLSEQIKAGDINKDGRSTSSDYVLIKNHIMGTNIIKQ